MDEPQIDVNSDSGFNRALAQAAGSTVSEERLAELDESDTSVASGLTTEESAQDRPRDEQGRFAPAAQPDTEEETEGAAPEQEEQTDPELASLLERHEGDVNAALAAALQERREAQSLIGRQGNELGQERQARQELAERLARLEGRLEAQPQAAAPQIVDERTAEYIDNLIADKGGHAALQWAIGQQNPQLIEATIDSWLLEDPAEATPVKVRYEVNKALYERDREQGQQDKPQDDQFVEQLRAERQMHSAMETVSKSMNEAEWGVIREHLVPTLEDEKTPDLIKNAVVSQDQDTQVQGINALVQLARGRVVAAATSQATQTRQAEVKAQKQAAQVATGSQRPVAQRQPGDEMSTEERIKRFHDLLMSTETTSVSDGLTYAR